MSALGSLVVKLALDYAEYTQGLDRSDQQALKFAQNTQKNFAMANKATGDFFKGVVSGSLAAVGGYLSLRAAIDGLSGSIDVLAQLDDASQKTGASVENLSRIQKTLAEYGHGFSEFEPMLSKLAKGMATVDDDSNKVNKALKALGISSKDAAGKTRDTAEVMIEAAQKLSEYKDSANKSGLAIDLLGKSGADALPKLNDLAEGVGRFTGDSKEAAANAALLQDRMSGMRARVDDAFTSLVIRLMPTLDKVTKALFDTTEGTQFFNKAGAFAKTVIEQLVITGAAVGFVFTTLGKTVSTVASQLMSMAKLDFRGVRDAGREWAIDLMKDYEDYDKFVVSILANAEKVEKAVDKLEEPKKDLIYTSGNDADAKAAAQRIESLNEASRKFLESLKNETLGVGQSSIQIKMLAAAKQAAITPSQELAVAIMTEAQAWAKLAQFQEDAKEEFAVLQVREDAYFAASNALESYARATDDANESAQFEISIMGKSAAEREVALAQRREELALKKQILAITDQVTNEDDRAALIEQANAIGASAVEGAKLQALARANADQWSQMWGTVEQTGKMAFTQLLAYGASSFKSIGQAIKASVIDLLYQLTARRWIINIGTSVTGSLFGSTASAATGGGGGGGMGTIASILQGGQSIYSALSGGLTGGLSAAVSGLGAMFGSSAVGAFGAGLGLSTSAAAGAAGAYGAAGMAGIGSAISAGAFVGMLLPPVAIATALTLGFQMLNGDKKIFGVGGFLGAFLFGPLAAMFGKGPKRYGPALLTGDFTGEGFSGEFQQDWKRSVGWFSGAKKRGTIGLGISAEADALFDSVVTGTAQIFKNLITATGDAQRSLDGWTYYVRRQVDTEEQQKQLTIDIANSMGDKLIPELEDLRLKGEALTDTAVRAQAIFRLVESTIDLTGQSFGKTGLASLSLRNDLVNLMGGIQNAGTMLSAYLTAFYSDAERTASGWRLLNIDMTNLGIDVLPTTRDQFRALVEAQDLSTESGQQMFVALMQLAPAFAQLTESAEQAKAAITLLTTDSFASLVDYTRYVRLAANEGIGPAPEQTYNPAPSTLAMGGVSAANAALLEQLRQLRAEQQAGDIAIAQNTAKMVEVLKKWEGDGMPEVRDIAA